ncbi:MAG: hypothetical protein ACYTGW_11560 [Planctomycetota bacterium]|jgi:hypothetical protein
MKHLILILLALFLVAPLSAQTRPQLKKQLRVMIAQAKKDTKLLFEAATFAKDHNFTTDYKRLINKILKIDKDHAGANQAMGRVKYEGQWISEADYKKKLAAKLEAKYKAAGKIRVAGVWVDKEHVADAKKGVFHHDGRLVNKWELLQFQLGKVRHPRTGRFMEATGLKKAEEGLIPLADGRWATVEEADKFHADQSRPWVIRTKYCFLISTMPLVELEKMAAIVDVGATSVLKIFGGDDPPPTRPPVIRIARTTGIYTTMGEQFGTGDDVYGVYIADGNAPGSTAKFQGGNSRLVLMNYGEPSWRPFFARHAAGLALCCSFFGDEIDGLPAWFPRGVAGYAERFLNEPQTKHFAKQHKANGGVMDLKDWYKDFKITIDISNKAVQANIFQAALLVAFCLRGGDKHATDALQRVTAACVSQKGGKAVPAVENLEKVLARRRDEIKAYFEKLIE